MANRRMMVQIMPSVILALPSTISGSRKGRAELQLHVDTVREQHLLGHLMGQQSSDSREPRDAPEPTRKRGCGRPMGTRDGMGWGGVGAQGPSTQVGHFSYLAQHPRCLQLTYGLRWMCCTAPSPHRLGHAAVSGTGSALRNTLQSHNHCGPTLSKLARRGEPLPAGLCSINGCRELSLWLRADCKQEMRATWRAEWRLRGAEPRSALLAQNGHSWAEREPHRMGGMLLSNHNISPAAINTW